MSVMKNGLWKWNFFGVKEFFSWILISKMEVKMNSRKITKNHAADSKIGSLFKIDSRADWTHESIPTAWELLSEKFQPRTGNFFVPNLIFFSQYLIPGTLFQKPKMKFLLRLVTNKKPNLKFLSISGIYKYQSTAH